MYIGKKLKEVLKREKITLAELSEKSRIDKKDCEDFLENRKEPTLEVFVQIVNALGVLPSEFIKIEGSVTKELGELQRKKNELPQGKQRRLFENIEKNLP